MKCIIVDDDVFSTRIISDFIKRTSSLSLVETFDNAIDAIDYLSRTSGMVQVIFLDIEMPEMSGLDFIKSIDCSVTQIIIYSSQEKYALQSYEYNVCDYLLKPVGYARYLKAVNKARMELELVKNAGEGGGYSIGELEEKKEDEVVEGVSMFVKDTSGSMYKVKYADILYIEAQENYVHLMTREGRIIIHSTMTKFVDGLPDEYIIRVHRSYAVGIKYLKNIVDGKIVLEGGDKPLPIGKSFKDSLKDVLDRIC